MANLGGTAVAIPQIGEEFIPHGVYIARCRLGYGDTTETGPGSSGGLDRWTDTHDEILPLFDINSTGVFVHMLTYDVETAFTTVVDICLGDGNDTDGFAGAAAIAATVVSTGVAIEASPSAYSRGKRYATTDSIDAYVVKADPTVGVINVYCVYSYAPEYAEADTGGSVNT